MIIRMTCISQRKKGRHKQWKGSRRRIDGSTELSTSDDVAGRFRAYGWHVIAGVDGHDPGAVKAAIEEARGHADAIRSRALERAEEILQRASAGDADASRRLAERPFPRNEGQDLESGAVDAAGRPAVSAT